MASAPSKFVRVSIFACTLLLVAGLMTDGWAGGSVKLYYEDRAQLEVISSAGTRILIDVYDRNRLSRPPSADDILLYTDKHLFHYNPLFCEAFPGKQLTAQVGKLHVRDVSIFSIASIRHHWDEYKNKDGSNYIMVIDVDGLRIAHFGIIGQKQLLQKQLEALGKVDIAIVPLATDNGLSVANRRAFKFMDQLKPRVIIPTDIIEMSASKIATEKWKAYNAFRKFITVSTEKMPESTSIIFMGQFNTYEKLPETKLY